MAFFNLSTLNLAATLLVALPLVAAEPSLEQRLSSVLLETTYQQLSFVGVSVVDSKTGETLFAQNSDKLFTPASNIKLYTSAAALDVFGPDHQFQTSVLHTGNLAGSTLNGNLVLRAGGDPTFTTANLQALAKQVAQKVKHVQGNLVVDATMFSSPLKGPGWMWDDDPEPFSMSISAMMLDYNVTKITVRKVGEKLQAELIPATDFPTVSFLGGTGPVTITRKPFESTFQVQGDTLPESGIVEAKLAVNEPALWIGNVFHEMLEKEGVEFSDGIVSQSEFPYSYFVTTSVEVAKAPVVGEELATIKSLRMTEILPLFNKPSENAIGEMLLHQLAGPSSAKPATWPSGSRALNTWLMETVGFPEGEVRIEDGSGLTRYNLISPDATIQLLQFMFKHPSGESYRASLPVSGVDGTLGGRLKLLPPNCVVQAKTGTMSGVSCLSGYVKDYEGNWRTFSVMVNGYLGSSATARDLQDRICLEIAGNPVLEQKVKQVVGQ